MINYLRILNDNGIEKFKDFLNRVRTGSKEAPPFELLTDEETSDSFDVDIELKEIYFENRYDLGKYLTEILKQFDRHKISRNHRLWNWLTLYFFDSICKKDIDGIRKILRPELYILDSKYNYLRYYKHLIRTPWLAVLDHGVMAKILFANTRGVRSDIEETLAASQQVLGNKTIISAAYLLYFDKNTEKPKRGAAGKGAGSPRRLTAVIQQLELTFDIQSCTSFQFLELLPQEFKKFKSSSNNK